MAVAAPLVFWSSDLTSTSTRLLSARVTTRDMGLRTIVPRIPCLCIHHPPFRISLSGYRSELAWYQARDTTWYLIVSSDCASVVSLLPLAIALLHVERAALHRYIYDGEDPLSSRTKAELMRKEQKTDCRDESGTWSIKKYSHRRMGQQQILT